MLLHEFHVLYFLMLQGEASVGLFVFLFNFELFEILINSNLNKYF